MKAMLSTRTQLYNEAKSFICTWVLIGDIFSQEARGDSEPTYNLESCMGFVITGNVKE